MAIRDSARVSFFLLSSVFAIIATLSVINGGKVTADNTVNVNRDDLLFTPPSSSSETARQDDYDDYFEDPDDSTWAAASAFASAGVLNDDSAQGPRSQKLSWAAQSPPTADKDNAALEPAPGQTSLVIVFDGTTTMYEDLQKLRQEAQAVIQKLNNRGNDPIYNYIFVSTRDPSESCGRIRRCGLRD